MEDILSKTKQKTLCIYCGKEISKSSVKRHETTCSKNVKAVAQNFECDHCYKLFKRSDTLKAHLKKCSENLGQPRKSVIPCNYVNCSKHFNTLSSLTSHLHNVHKAPMHSPQTLTFENETDFIDWKEEEQARSFSYFAKKCGDHNSNEGQTKYFYCQQHGSEKAHRKKEEVNRKTDRRVARGRIKTGGVCISSMKATYLKDGSVTVVYQPTHSHPLSPSSVQFHPLSSESHDYIDTQLLAGVSPLAIKRELKCRAIEKANMLNLENKDNQKDCLVSLKLIRERARRLQNSVIYQMDDDAMSVMLDTPHLEIVVSDNKQTFFPEPVMELTADEKEKVERKRYRETHKRRLRINVNKILMLVENENVSDDILCKLDAEVYAALKRSEALVEDKGETTITAASGSNTPSERAETQVSQMLSFKRPKKRKKPFDAVAAAANKKAVSADLL